MAKKRFVCKVLNTDSVPDDIGDTFAPKSLIYEKTIPVFFTMDKGLSQQEVGTAFLTEQAEGYYAECSVDFKFPKGAKLFPSVAGVVNHRGGPDGRIITEAHIDRLLFHYSPNSDKRIEPVIL